MTAPHLKMKTVTQVAAAFLALVVLLFLALFRPDINDGSTVVTVKANVDVPTNGHAQEIAPSTVDIYYNGRDELRDLVVSTFGSYNDICTPIDDERIKWKRDLAFHNATSSTPPVITVHISFGCRDFFEHSEAGTGNLVEYIYSTRLAFATYGHVHLNITCTDAEATKEQLVSPWIMGFHPSVPPNTHFVQHANFHAALIHVACGNYMSVPTAYMVREMQQELRHMAISLVGHPVTATSARAAKTPPHASRSRLQLVEPHTVNTTPHSTPVYAHMPMDDVILHFRCGDVITHAFSGYVFLKFHGYTRSMSPDARTIGIVTQPFSGSQTRATDTSDTAKERCPVVVASLVAYIQERHPLANVSVYNDPDETIALTYCRMIWANQTIVTTSSSLSLFPAFATFGHGYFLSPSRHHPDQRQWVVAGLTEPDAPENVELVEGNECLTAGEISQLWNTYGQEHVLNWFRK